MEAKLNGFNALAPGPVESPTESQLSDAVRLEQGPAYGKIGGAKSSNNDQGDWPTYRHDAARSGTASSEVKVDLNEAWRTKIGGRVSSPVIAGGRVFVASVDRHTVHALDAADGRLQWSYTAGGRVDSPPTVYRGLVLFGSADGCVYALRAADGVLAWRYRAAPIDRRMVAFEQVESAWPVHGSVLVHDETLYCTAGRSIFLDGGIRLLQLDPLTGRKLSETVMDELDPQSGENMQVHVKRLNMPVALSDVFSCDGKHLYMRSQKIDLEGNRLEIPVENVDQQPAEGSHLFCQVGFLDDSWFHRSFWTFGRRVSGGYGSWLTAGRMVPAGRILVFDDQTVYGYGRKPQYYVNASVLEHHLFAAEKHVTPEAIDRISKANREINARSNFRNANSSDWKVRRGFPVEDLTATRYRWALDQPAVQIRAMLAAGDKLFVAGHPDFVDERRALRLPDDANVKERLQRQADALEGRYGGRLWVVSKTDGRPTARWNLKSPPVFDGLAAAGGRLFVSTIDGSVLCLGSDGTTPLERANDADPLQIISDEPEEPDYLKPPEVNKSADFTKVMECRVVEAKLGYRIIPNGSKRVCLALNKLDTPLAGKGTLTSKLKCPGTQGFLTNGFIVFGDGTAEGSLVKCGIRFKLQKAMIIQGGFVHNLESTDTKIDAPTGSVVDVTVSVDLSSRKVTLTTAGATVHAKLQRPLESITHVGFATDSAVAEFGPLEVSQ